MMWRVLLQLTAVCSALAALGGPVAARVGPDDGYIRVEMKGALLNGLPSRSAAQEKTAAKPALVANGFRWELDLSKDRAKFEEGLNRPDGSQIKLWGELEKRRGPSGEDRLVLVVDRFEALNATRPAVEPKATADQLKRWREVLVMFKPNQRQAAIAAAREAGLELLSFDDQSRLLKMRPTEKVDDKSIRILEQSPSISDYGPNTRVSIPEGAGPNPSGTRVRLPLP